MHAQVPKTAWKHGWADTLLVTSLYSKDDHDMHEQQATD